MNDQEFIQSNASKIAQMQAALDEAEAALDVEGRARQEGFDYVQVVSAMSEALQAAGVDGSVQAQSPGQGKP